MPFHSPQFALLCALTLSVYYLSGERWQHAVLLVSSAVFYCYAGIADACLLACVITFNYFVGLRIGRRDSLARWLLAAVIVINLGVLGYFKYGEFLVDLLSGRWEPTPKTIAIPLGISFYIFQLIGYQVDVWKSVLEPERSYLRMVLYILFFPHHQAGPIMRPVEFLPQFIGVKRYLSSFVKTGGLWILWGLFKKVLADQLATMIDPRFADYRGVSGASDAWFLALRYTAQIYLDFSGYSDIAIGLGQLFGYRLDRNFNQPYLARDPSEFWQRWHITLSRWLRDYLYIPLGGNRGGSGRTYVNLMLTMVLGGIWHGAALTFVLWGAIHGGILLVHRRFPWLFANRVVGWAITFLVTVIAWIPFRAASFAAMRHLLFEMCGAGGTGSRRYLVEAIVFAGVLITTQVLEDRVVGTPAARKRSMTAWLRVPGVARGALLATATVLVIALLVDKTTYIYFRF